MTNDEGTENQTPAQTGEVATEGQPATESEARKFTQAEVDEMITKRLAKEKSARDREDARREAERQKQAEIDALEGEAKLKAQYQADLEKANTEKAEAQRELRVARAGVLLGKAGLNPDFAEMMTGETDEATQANVERFAQTVREEASKMAKASMSRGAPPIPENGATQDDKLWEKMRQYAGLPQKK